MIALTRLVTKDTMIPTTTALCTANPDFGRALGLMCGANVIMPDATPPEFKKWYEIYPERFSASSSIETQLEQINDLVQSLGRYIAADAGHRIQRRYAVG